MAITVAGNRGTVLTASMTAKRGSDNLIHKYAAEAWRWLYTKGQRSNPFGTQTGYTTYWG